MTIRRSAGSLSCTDRKILSWQEKYQLLCALSGCTAALYASLGTTIQGQQWQTG